MIEFIKKNIVIAYLVLFIFLSGVASIVAPNNALESTIVVDSLMAYLIYSGLYKDKLAAEFKSFSFDNIIYMLGLGIATYLICSNLGYFLINSGFTQGLETYQKSINSSGVIAKILLTVMVAPIFEEFMFRVSLLSVVDSIRPKFKYVYVVFVAFVFGSIHGTLYHAVIGTLFALILSFVYLRYKSVLNTIVLHIVYNVLAVTGLGLYKNISFGILLIIAITCVVLHKKNKATDINQ